MASNVLGAACMALDLVVASEVFAFAGPILALVGVVLTLVEMFLPHPRPESPVEEYVRAKVVPFVNNLPFPPTGWKPVVA